jgi:hypothetical protein
MGSIRMRVHGDYRGIFPLERTEGMIYAFWHQRMLPFGHTHRRTRARVLISSHGDGDLIARILGRLGLRPVRGSSTRGGSKALRELLADLGSGHDYAFTPDGPRGPPHVFQPGAIYFASRSGLPILLVTIAYARAWKLPTWDGFVVPFPFSRAVVCLEPLVRVPPELGAEEIEEWRARLEQTLRALTAGADDHFAERWAEAVRPDRLRERMRPPAQKRSRGA